MAGEPAPVVPDGPAWTAHALYLGGPSLHRRVVPVVDDGNENVRERGVCPVERLGLVDVLVRAIVQIHVENPRRRHLVTAKTPDLRSNLDLYSDSSSVPTWGGARCVVSGEAEEAPPRPPAPRRPHLERVGLDKLDVKRKGRLHLRARFQVRLRRHHNARAVAACAGSHYGCVLAPQIDPDCHVHLV